jgi:large subunit ribosomal protein L25
MSAQAESKTGLTGDLNMAGNQTLNLNAEKREAGKHFSRTLRKGRMIPCVVYGPKTKPLNLSIGENDAIRCSKHGFENSIFTLQSKDGALNGMKVLRKAIDIHPLSRRPVHLDFFAPDMTKVVRVDVEIRLTGKAQGITEGGLVSQVRRDIEIECLPLEIPEFFELDISPMGLNESMHVSDLNVPSNFKIITSTDETLVTCAIVAEEVAAPVVAAADATAAAAAPGAAGAPAAPGAAGAPAAAAAAPAKK